MNASERWKPPSWLVDTSRNRPRIRKSPVRRDLKKRHMKNRQACLPPCSPCRRENSQRSGREDTAWRTPSNALQLLVGGTSRIQQGFEGGEAPQDLVGLVLVVRQVLLQRLLGVAGDAPHLLAEQVADYVAIFRETFWGLPGAKRSEKLATGYCLRRPAPSCVRHASILRASLRIPAWLPQTTRRRFGCLMLRLHPR
jgi:hypothetical protein